MQLRTGEQYTLDTDPVFVLMLAECEDVRDEQEAQAQMDYWESVMLSLQYQTSTSQE